MMKTKDEIKAKLIQTAKWNIEYHENKTAEYKMELEILVEK